MNNYIKSLLCSLIIIGLFGCSQMTPEERYAQAKNFYQQKDYGEATISAKQLVAESPRNPEYRAFLAELHLLGGDLDAAQKEFQRAIEYGIDLSAVSRSQVDLELFRNNYADAFELLLERQGAFMDKGEWNAYAAVTALVTADNDLLERSLAYLSEQGEQYADFVSAAQLVNAIKPTEAAAVLLESSEQVKAPEIEFVIGTSLVEAGDHPSAQAILEQYSEKRPQNRIANYFLARSYLATDDEEKARPQIDIVRQGNDNNALGQYIDAVYHYQTGQMDMAAELAQKSLDGGINNPINYFIVGVEAFQKENFERALSAFEYLNQVSPTNLAIKRMLSAVQLRLGDVVSASKSITGIGAPEPEDIDIILMTGFRAMQSSQSDSVLSELSRFAKGVKAQNVSDALGLALLDFTQNEDEGITQLEQVFNSDPKNANAFAILATAYVQTGNVEKAERLVNQILTTDAELGVTTREIVANVLLQLGKLIEAEQQFASIRQAEPERASVLMFDVVFAEAKQDFIAAVAAAERYVGILPQDFKGFLKLNQLLDSSSADSAAYESMYSQLAKVDNPEHQLFLANKLIGDRKLQRAETVLNGVSAPSAESKKSTMLGYIALGNGNAEKALSLVRPILTVEPNNAGALQIALRANASNNDYLSNTNLIDKALSIDPNNSALNYLKAVNLVYRQDFSEAQKVLVPLLNQNDQLAVRALQGKIHLGNREFVEAYPYMLEAYSASPSQSRLLDLIATLNGLEKLEDRSLLLDSYISNNPDNVGVRMLQAEYLLRQDAAQGAAALETIFAKYPDNAVALNNLSFAYLQLEQLQKALDTIEKALAIKPNTFAFLLSKSRILIAQGKIDQGLANLEPYLDLAKGEPVKYVFDYLHMLVDAGRVDQARFHFEQYRALRIEGDYMQDLEVRLNR